jgi:hypothetical protein
VAVSESEWGMVARTCLHPALSRLGDRLQSREIPSHTTATATSISVPYLQQLQELHPVVFINDTLLAERV